MKLSKNDRTLGMDRSITRRDILNGATAMTATSLLPHMAFAEQVASSNAAPYYPPALTGMRGNHDGSFENAHMMGLEGNSEWGPVIEPQEEVYDVIVVGAGMSGLAAAHFYRKEKPDARILILDNHDDFGGHAKRNEFTVGGKTILGYGGSQTVQEPSDYSDVAKQLLDDLNIDLDQFYEAYDQEFFVRNNLRAGIFFDQPTWGVNRTVPYDYGFFDGYLQLAPNDLSAEEAAAQMPISEAAQKDIIRLLTLEEDQIPEIQGEEEKWTYLDSLSYRDFLTKHMGITEPEVFDLLQNLTTDFGLGIEAVTAAGAIFNSGLPGWEAAGLPPLGETEPYVHHFPDGNASIARMILRAMIPETVTGTTMSDILTAAFDYNKLDTADSNVRMRLNSTAVRVKHDGAADSAEEVHVTYIKDGQAYKVRGRGCVLACNNSLIPFLCAEMPEAQREALGYGERTPILYTSVAVSNWRAWKDMGIGSFVAPTSYHAHVTMDFPVSLGNYVHAANPDEPLIIHMERFPHVNNEGLTAREQYRAGRYELLSTPFETIERNVREQLGAMLGEAGFDPATDIQGITVNRWAHGYAFFYNSLFDERYEDRNDERYPHVIGRKPFGRITIANSDAAARPLLDSAIDEGHRAVMELLNA